MYILVGLNKETGEIFADSYSHDRDAIEASLASVVKLHKGDLVIKDEDWTFECVSHLYTISDTAVPESNVWNRVGS